MTGEVKKKYTQIENGKNSFQQEENIAYCETECFIKEKTIGELCLEHGIVWSRNTDHRL